MGRFFLLGTVAGRLYRLTDSPYPLIATPDMTRLNGQPRAPIATWWAESLRATFFFPSADHLPDAAKEWAKLLQSEPDATIDHPKAGSKSAAGQRNDTNFLIQTSKPNRRLDLISTDEAVSFAPKNGFPQTAADFIQLTTEWIETIAESLLTRVAFGGTALLPQSDVVAAYRTISDYLQFDVDRSTGSDFLFQINRPRPSQALPGTNVNRLTRWSVATMQIHSIEPGPSMQPPQLNLAQAEYACRVEFDINTAVFAGAGSFAAKSAIPLFSEMLRFVEELLRDGDTP